MKRFLKSLDVIKEMLLEIADKSKGDINKYKRMMEDFQNSPQYERYLFSVVRRMISPIAVANMSTWRRAAKKSTRGQFFYSLLQDELKTYANAEIETLIVENVNLIKTLPTDVADKVVRNVYSEAFTGARSSTIAKHIKSETDKHAGASSRLIARTEVSKATSLLTKIRSEELDIHWYVWRTALDGDRVRKSHKTMEGVLVNWNDPPSPEELVGEKNVGRYHAGNIYNCRCYPEPLIEIDDVKWPHKVYHNGSIKTMTKTEFENIL